MGQIAYILNSKNVLIDIKEEQYGIRYCHKTYTSPNKNMIGKYTLIWSEHGWNYPDLMPEPETPQLPLIPVYMDSNDLYQEYFDLFTKLSSNLNEGILPYFMELCSVLLSPETQNNVSPDVWLVGSLMVRPIYESLKAQGL